jgi:dihydrofolate reductase
MTKLRVSGYTISLDGYGAGADQSLEAPMGAGVDGLHAWLLGTSAFKKEHGGTAVEPSAPPDADELFAQRAMANLGAWIMGRNMFAASRGPWTDDGWTGWWGPNPPYHVPVFVLTHHARPSLSMEGGTVFHFVTDGIHAALERARAAAGGKDIRVGGGAATVRAYVQAGLVDELHLAISPILIGRGEHLLGGIDMKALGYQVSGQVTSPKALHVVLTK